MSTISVTNIDDGDAVTAASVNNQINTIVNDYNGNITDANISASANIGAQKLAGGVSGMFGAWVSWTPTWGGGVTAIGNAVVTAAYIQIGKAVKCRIKFVAGSTTTFTTSGFTFTLPVNAIAASASHMCGNVYIEDAGVAGYQGSLQINTATTVNVLIAGTGSTYATNATVTSAVPFTWGNGDFFEGFFIYEAA